MQQETLRYWLALLQIKGVGPVLFAKLLAHCDDIKRLFNMNIQQLQALALPDRVCREILRPNWCAVDKTLQWAEHSNRHIIALPDEMYPALLREIPDAPPILFVEGQVDFLQKPQIAIVGSRNPTPSGRELAFGFAAELSRRNFVITSGLASGIDGLSHQGALSVKGQTNAVMGTSLDMIYPKKHTELAASIQESGTLVSELMLGAPLLPQNFPRRNRIISGLSVGVLVVEAAVKSGSLITAHQAVSQGREVFAIPGSIHNPLARGCHAIIRQGAKLVEKVEDIVEELAHFAQDNHTKDKSQGNNPVHVSSNGGAMKPEYARVIQEIGYESTPIDAIKVRSGLSLSILSEILLELELEGLVKSMPGGYARLGEC